VTLPDVAAIGNLSEQVRICTEKEGLIVVPFFFRETEKGFPIKQPVSEANAISLFSQFMHLPLVLVQILPEKACSVLHAAFPCYTS